MNESYEFQGKTVDDAIAEGLIKLGLSREQVEIEVIHKGSRGIFGLGSEPARIRLTTAAPPTSPPSIAPFSSDSDWEKSDAGSRTAVDVKFDGVPKEPADDLATTAGLETSALDDHADDDAADDDMLAAELPDDDVSDDDMSDGALAEVASGLLGQMVLLMGYDADVTATWQEPEPGEHENCLLLEVNGDNLGALIGRRGETLSNIQFLLRLMINQKTHSWYNIVVDVAGYKERRAEQLTKLALRIAQQVAESRRSASLEPMPSNERRVIHMALREHPDVFTQSSGEGERRKVHVVPRD